MWATKKKGEKKRGTFGIWISLRIGKTGSSRKFKLGHGIMIIIKGPRKMTYFGLMISQNSML